MEKGFSNLEKSTFEKQISGYHLLASSSAYHCSANSYHTTDWKSILALYDRLIQIDQSPVVSLNRTIALSKVSGAEKALEALEQIKNSTPLQSYHLFYSTKAAFHIELQQFREASTAIETAIELAALPNEKYLLQKKWALCQQKIN